MIAYIKGILKQKNEGYIVIENNSVGYLIYVSNNTLSALPLQNQSVEILTYMHVKEDDIVLYGFLSIEEKTMFLKLIEISGIGPKLAMSILSGVSYSQLAVAVAKQDIETLTKIKGLGKKTAERICLELKDKVNIFENVTVAPLSSSLKEAIEALITLGMGRNQANELVTSVAKEGSTVEEIITLALQNMGR